jgi:ribosomal protein L31
MPKSLFLRYVLSENHPSFEGKNTFINSHIFRRVVKFGMCYLEFQTGLISSIKVER